jgi:hypothetical protein
MEAIVDYNYNRFILIDKNKTEHVISTTQATKLQTAGHMFTDIATNELEEAHYEEAMEHYLGADEAYS